MWGMRRAGMTLGLKWPRLTDDVRHLVRLGVPGVISGGVTQINIAIGTVIASLQPGAVSQLYYADRVYELPLSIVGVAVGIVLLPDVARQLRAGNMVGVMDSQNRSLEFALLFTIPAALALAIIPHDIIRVLFERGAFHAEDTAATAAVLAMFALGLPAFVMIKVFSPAYFAREDTKTPMRYAVISLTANTIGSIVLFFVFRSLGMMPQLGIAVATTLGGWLNAYLLWATLHRHKNFVADARLRRNVPWIIIASVVMSAALLLASNYLAPHLGADSRFIEKTSALALEIGIGFAVFTAIIMVTGVMSLRQLGALIGRGGKA
jgi:putative peptidoglycan lipid II flippase